MGFFDFLKKKVKAVQKHSPVGVDVPGVGDVVDVPDAGDVAGVDVPTVPTSASGIAAEAGVDVPGTHDIPGADAAAQAQDAADTAQTAKDVAAATKDDPDKPK